MALKVSFVTTHLKLLTVGDDDFQLLEPLVALIEENGNEAHLVVPAGFETDFESVPRVLTIAYSLIKNKARMSSTLHDYLCRVEGVDRRWADKVFKAAMESEGTGFFARNVAYAGVWMYTTIGSP